VLHAVCTGGHFVNSGGQRVATGLALQLVSVGGQTVTATDTPHAVATGGHFV